MWKNDFLVAVVEWWVYIWFLSRLFFPFLTICVVDSGSNLFQIIRLDHFYYTGVLYSRLRLTLQGFLLRFVINRVVTAGFFHEIVRDSKPLKYATVLVHRNFVKYVDSKRSSFAVNMTTDFSDMQSHNVWHSIKKLSNMNECRMHIIPISLTQ